ncbi:MAG: hypothetical protein MZW92_04935 [Comamonadaceae bacterium]|nr:hypothetical protein [Comamonadaceae bacterium]
MRYGATASACVFAELMGTAAGLGAPTRETLEAHRPPVGRRGHSRPRRAVRGSGRGAAKQAFARLARLRGGRRAARPPRREGGAVLLAAGKRRTSPAADLPGFLAGVSLYRDVNLAIFVSLSMSWLSWLIRDLERAGAVRREGDRLVAADDA